MASTGKCPFCGAVVTSDQKTCPECGGENPGFVVDTPQRIMNPKTIEELKEYCAERGMPLLRMRFFIGVNTPEAKAFGIYREGDTFIVYKNKANGTRAVRYQGPDEQTAVRELHAKLLDECHMRGIYPDGEKPAGTRNTGTVRRDSVPGYAPRKSKEKTRGWFWVILAAFFGLFVLINTLVTSYKSQPLSTGYYYEEGQPLYYHIRSPYSYEYEWYVYDNGWKGTEKPKGKLASKQDFAGEKYNPAWNATAIPKVNDRELETGYYLYEGQLYHCDVSDYGVESWRTWSTVGNNTRWNTLSGRDRFPYHDPEGYLFDCTKYYAGTVFDPGWEGYEYNPPEGYYRYEDQTYFYVAYYGDTNTELWYQDTGSWKLSVCPVNNCSSYYQGFDYDPEWGGSPFPNAVQPEDGYYTFEGKLYYYSANSKLFDPKASRWGYDWHVYDQSRKEWLSTQIPRTDKDGNVLVVADCFLGSKYKTEFGGYDYVRKNGYYRYNGTTYYSQGSSWYVYRNRQWVSSSYPISNFGDYYEGNSVSYDWNTVDYDTYQKQQESSSSRYDSDWSSSDYDSWDSSDTDWDSDW